MADATAPDGGSTWGVFNPARYVTDGYIQWQDLLATIFGATVGAWFTGFADVVLSLFDIPIALLGGLATFGASVVRVVVGFPAVMLRSGFTAAIPFVVDAGIAGFVAAVGIVLGSFLVVSWVVSRVGE